MHITKVNKTFLVLLLLTLEVKAFEFICNPGEEYHSQNLTVHTDNNNKTFQWIKEPITSPFAYCSVLLPNDNYTCFYNKTLYSVFFKEKKIRTLNILNVTRDNIGQYTYIEDVDSMDKKNRSNCDFKMFARPKRLTCQEPKSFGENVSYLCEIEGVFPEPMCLVTRITEFQNLTSVNSTVYSNFIQSDSYKYPTYFNGNCSLYLSIKELGIGSHKFQLQAFPNMTGNNNDTAYGKNSNFTSGISINPPTVLLDDCFGGIYLEGTNITCTCKETANSFFKPTVEFYIDDQKKSESQGLLQYSFTIDRKMKALSCRTRILNYTSAMNTTTTAAYGPNKVILKATQNGTEKNATIDLCDKNNQVNLDIRCEVPEDDVNPKARMQLFVNGNETSKNDFNFINFTYTAKDGGQLNLSCFGSNDNFSQLNKTAEILLNVTEPPMEPYIYIDLPVSTQQPSSEKNITTAEGYITIGCKAEKGYPLATSITVKCGSGNATTNASNEAFISLNISKSMDMDNCSCSASHPSSCYRKNSTMVVLNVIFPSNVLSMKINDQEENITVERNSSVTISCVGEGNPSPTMLLTKKNSQLESCSNPNEKFNLNLTVTKELTDCRDTGVFVCEAGNSSKNITVFVYCAQELLDPTMNNTVYNASINSNFNINIPLLGYPVPKYYLTSDGHLNSSNYNLSYIKLEPPYGTLSLTIFSVRKEMFQNYTLNITNERGSLIYRFQINISDYPEVVKSSNNEGYDIGAIVGGVAAGVVVVVAIILIIILLKRKGIVGKKDKSVSNEVLAADKDVDNSKIYEMNKVEVDNSDIYNLNSDSQQTDVDNADIYNMQSQLPVEVDNASIYNMKKTDSEKPRKNSEYKKYTDVKTTVTTASAAPKNMKTTVIPETTYEDVNGAAKLESKAIPKPSKPVPKPKPGQQLTKSDQNKAGNSVGTDQTYSTVVIEKKAAKPVTVKDKKEKELDFNTTEPEIPERKYEKKENNVNAKEQKALLNPTPDYDNVINTTNENPESTTIINSEFSNRQKDTDMYANVTDAPFHPTPDYHNVIESTNGNPESTIGTNSGISHAQMDTDVYANMTE